MFKIPLLEMKISSGNDEIQAVRPAFFVCLSVSVALTNPQPF